MSKIISRKISMAFIGFKVRLHNLLQVQVQYRRGHYKLVQGWHLPVSWQQHLRLKEYHPHQSREFVLLTPEQMQPDMRYFSQRLARQIDHLPPLHAPDLPPLHVTVWYWSRSDHQS